MSAHSEGGGRGSGERADCCRRQLSALILQELRAELESFRAMNSLGKEAFLCEYYKIINNHV